MGFSIGQLVAAGAGIALFALYRLRTNDGLRVATWALLAVGLLTGLVALAGGIVGKELTDDLLFAIALGVLEATVIASLITGNRLRFSTTMPIFFAGSVVLASLIGPLVNSEYSNFSALRAVGFGMAALGLLFMSLEPTSATLRSLMFGVVAATGSALNSELSTRYLVDNRREPDPWSMYLIAAAVLAIFAVSKRSAALRLAEGGELPAEHHGQIGGAPLLVAVAAAAVLILVGLLPRFFNEIDTAELGLIRAVLRSLPVLRIAVSLIIAYGLLHERLRRKEIVGVALLSAAATLVVSSLPQLVKASA
jgi:hypothetical protein